MQLDKHVQTPQVHRVFTVNARNRTFLISPSVSWIRDPVPVVHNLFYNKSKVIIITLMMMIPVPWLLIPWSPAYGSLISRALCCRAEGEWDETGTLFLSDAIQQQHHRSLQSFVGDGPWNVLCNWNHHLNLFHWSIPVTPSLLLLLLCPKSVNGNALVQ